MTDINNLPQHLKNSGLFCVWNYEQRNGQDKPTKVPYNPSTGGKAQPNNPATFASLTVAEAVQSKYDGLGVGIFNDICAVDIDHCVDENGHSEMCSDIISTMTSYTEYSPSGTGIRILFKAAGFGYDKSKYYINNQKLGLEIYVAGATKKYVTVTGNVLEQGGNIEERGAELQLILDKYMLRNSKPPTHSAITQSTISLSDDELIAKAHNAKGGAAFAMLWGGDTSGYKSHSEADLALCNKLAFWTGCDATQMDRIFRVSGLMREKWDRTQSGSTYGQFTVNLSISGCKTTYDPQKHFEQQVVDDFAKYIDLSALTNINPLENCKRYSLDDLGTSRLFADIFRDKILYLPEYKSYWVYDSGIWKQDKGDLSSRQLAKAMTEYVCSLIPPPPDVDSEEEDRWKNHRNHYSRYRSLGYRKILLQDSQDELSGSSDEFDRQTLFFNCKNGTLNLQTMQLMPHEPADRLSKMANVVYDPNARYERYDRFISEITENIGDRANMLQKSLGYCLKGEADEECYFTIIGQKTRNGKGTLLDTIMNIFGSYGSQIDFNSIARGGAKDGSRATPDIARLIGVRLALANEPERGVCINEALVKQLTGNDDLTARPLYGDVIQFKPVFRLFVTANSKPTVSDDSLFTSGRIKLLPFTRFFSEKERNTHLKSEFRTDAAKSSILNWLIAGYQKYCIEKLTDTDEMKILTEEYRRENDLVGQFLDDRFDLSIDEMTTVKAMRIDYARWCDVVGAKAMGLKLFKEELDKRDLQIKISHKQYVVIGKLKIFCDYVS